MRVHTHPVCHFDCTLCCVWFFYTVLGKGLTRRIYDHIRCLAVAVAHVFYKAEFYYSDMICKTVRELILKSKYLYLWEPISWCRYSQNILPLTDGYKEKKVIIEDISSSGKSWKYSGYRVFPRYNELRLFLSKCSEMNILTKFHHSGDFHKVICILLCKTRW